MNKRQVLEENNALEGAFWPVKERLANLNRLYTRYRLLTPYTYKPFVKFFNSFQEYEKWKKKQKNPWFW